MSRRVSYCERCGASNILVYDAEGRSLPAPPGWCPRCDGPGLADRMEGVEKISYDEWAPFPAPARVPAVPLTDLMAAFAARCSDQVEDPADQEDDEHGYEEADPVGTHDTGRTR